MYCVERVSGSFDPELEEETLEHDENGGKIGVSRTQKI
jgi:hypothetical protein